MAGIYDSAERLIGGTPLLNLSRLAERKGVGARILAKLECFNLTGSSKDRIAASMIDAAEADGRIRPGSVIIEPTSGNTGIGLAAVGTLRGYRVVLVMPETMSAERIALMRAYGAEVELTSGSLGMRGAIERAGELARETPGSFIPSQFDNPANADAHFRTTGPEIMEDSGGSVDVLVAGVGTGGTVTGAGRYLKSVKPSVRVVAVEPASSPVLSGGRPGPHGIQGIGAGFVPAVLDMNVVDEVIAVADEDAFEAARLLCRTEGVLVGISAGAALFAAVSVASRPENKGRSVVVVLPDSGSRYLSGSLFR